MNGSWKKIAPWAVLAVAAVGGGYWLFRQWSSTPLPESLPPAGGFVPAGGSSASATTAYNPVPVRKGVLSATRSKNFIRARTAGMKYALIVSTNALTGYRSFRSPVDGYFTGNLLVLAGNKTYAEIQPG